MLLGHSSVWAGGMAALQDFMMHVHAARGEFVQKQLSTKGLKGLKGSHRSKQLSGTFVFQRPGKFIWTYCKPYEQVLQTDGTVFYIYDKDLNQVTTRRIDDAINKSAAAILAGSNNLNHSFYVREAPRQRGLDWVELLPKTQDSPFQRIRIGFFQASLAVMELQDTFGNVAEITFAHVEKNPVIPSGLFKFVLPPGVDRVEG